MTTSLRRYVAKGLVRSHPPERLAYRQIMYWVVVRSFAAALRGHVVGWGKPEQTNMVEIPA